MPLPRLIIMGVSGCGKSTVGERLGARTRIPFIEGDTLHPPRNVALMAVNGPSIEMHARLLVEIISIYLSLFSLSHSAFMAFGPLSDKDQEGFAIEG